MEKMSKRIYFVFILTFLVFLNLFFYLVSLEISTQNYTSTESSAKELIPHVVLVELFVQGSCTTCPTAEFCLEDLAWEYGTSKFILVQEHIWDDGYDTPETNARYDWYVGEGTKGTPDVFIDGLTKRIQGLFCECAEENYQCYKEAIDGELNRLSFIQISATRRQEGSALIIEGSVKNLSYTPLEDLAICGMLGREKNEPGLYNYIQDIFPFQEISILLPGAVFNFCFSPKIPLPFTGDVEKEEGTPEILHLVVFVQNLKTKEILQSLYVE